jgi:hypothetical protein
MSEWVDEQHDETATQQFTLDFTIYVVGKNHQDTMILKETILSNLKRYYGIRKLADMGDHVTLEYRTPEFEWTFETALSQLEHGGRESNRTKSAVRYMEEFKRLHVGNTANQCQFTTTQ